MNVTSIDYRCMFPSMVKSCLSMCFCVLTMVAQMITTVHRDSIFRLHRPADEL